MKKERLKNKGITLIALVITIVVLLILAGVTIATLMGDNRNINKGKWCKNRNRRSKRRWIKKINTNRSNYESKKYRLLW